MLIKVLTNDDKEDDDKEDEDSQYDDKEDDGVHQLITKQRKKNVKVSTCQ